MRSPTKQTLSIDPELAIIHALDVASDMTIALLSVFHPPDDDVPEATHSYSHHVACKLVNDALRLRQTLAAYDNALHFDRGPQPPNDAHRDFDDSQDIPF